MVDSRSGFFGDIKRYCFPVIAYSANCIHRPHPRYALKILNTILIEMTQHTNYLAIDVKVDDEKAGDLPELRKTPRMPAAGWGGSGTILQEMSMDYMEAPMLSKRLAAAPSEQDVQFSIESRDGFKQRNINDFIDAVNILHSGAYSSTLALSSIQDLQVHGVPEDIAEDLIEVYESGIEEHVVVVAFLYLLSQHERVNIESLNLFYETKNDI